MGTSRQCWCWSPVGSEVDCSICTPSSGAPPGTSKTFPLDLDTILTKPSGLSANCHCWFCPPLRVYCWIFAPSSGLDPGKSRALPVDSETISTKPLSVGTSFQCWLLPRLSINCWINVQLVVLIPWPVIQWPEFFRSDAAVAAGNTAPCDGICDLFQGRASSLRGLLIEVDLVFSITTRQVDFHASEFP